MPDFIYDRTAQDTEVVKYLNRVMLDGTATEEEQALWATDLKGALNDSDLERNVDNITLLEEMLNISTTSLEVPDIPTESFYTSLRTHLATIRASGYITSTTPNVPSSPLNSWLK